MIFSEIEESISYFYLNNDIKYKMSTSIFNAVAGWSFT